jgi:hypothetical protein
MTMAGQQRQEIIAESQNNKNIQVHMLWLQCDMRPNPIVPMKTRKYAFNAPFQNSLRFRAVLN